MKKYIFAALFLFSIVHINCRRTVSKIEDPVVVCQESQIDSIRVFYYNFSFESYIMKRCDDVENGKKPAFKRIKEKLHPFYPVDYLGVFDTLLVDCEPLINIENELKNLHRDERGDFSDARFVAKVYFKNGEQSQICICGNSATAIYLNGELQNVNNRLLYLLKLYSGYYSWFSREKWKYFKELNDTTFVRDSITMTYENNPRVR